MVRTQIQLTEEQAAKLRRLSAERRVSVAELIRMGVDELLQKESGVSRERKRARAKSAAGRFASGAADVSVEHDRYLAETFGAP